MKNTIAPTYADVNILTSVNYDKLGVMKRLRLTRSANASNQAGFIPLLLTILFIVVVGIIFVFFRVKTHVEITPK